MSKRNKGPLKKEIVKRDRASLLFDDPIEPISDPSTINEVSSTGESRLVKNNGSEMVGDDGKDGDQMRQPYIPKGLAGDEYPTDRKEPKPRFTNFADMPIEWIEEIAQSQYGDALKSTKPRDRNRSARFFLDAQKQLQAENLKIQLNNQVNVNVSPTIIVEHDAGFFPAPLSETARNSETPKIGAPDSPKL